MNMFSICPRNAVKTARLILELDSAAINERYYPDSATGFQRLKQLLEQYSHTPSREVNIDRLEAQLTALMACVKECMALLTPEAQQQISDYLQLMSVQKLVSH